MTSHRELPFQEYGKRICPHWSIRSRQEAKSTRRKSLDGDKMKIDHFDVLLSNQSDKPYIGGETVQVSQTFLLVLDREILALYSHSFELEEISVSSGAPRNENYACEIVVTNFLNRE